MQFPEHVHELKPEHYDIAGVPTFLHTEWDTYDQIPPKGALCCTISRNITGESEFFVGDGIHKYSDLAKGRRIYRYAVLLPAASAIVKADETGRAHGLGSCYSRLPQERGSQFLPGHRHWQDQQPQAYLSMGRIMRGRLSSLDPSLHLFRQRIPYQPRLRQRRRGCFYQRACRCGRRSSPHLRVWQGRRDRG